MDWELVQQFFSMARSEGGIAGQNLLASTRKSLTGTMQKLLDRIRYDESFPFKLYVFCFLEVAAPCGCAPGGCEYRAIVRSGDQKSFADVCQGRLRHADGFYPLSDLLRKFTTLDPEVWDAEWECRKPVTSGLVYAFPEERYVPLSYRPDRDTWGACDAGVVDPFCFLLLQADASDNVYSIRELYGSDREESFWADEMLELLAALGRGPRHGERFPVHVDVRAKNLALELKKRGFDVRARSYSVVETIKHVRKWVYGQKHPALFIDPDRCPNLKREMGTYRRGQGEMPAARQSDHAVDCLRYGICGRYPLRWQQPSAELPRATQDTRRWRRSEEEVELWQRA